MRGYQRQISYVAITVIVAFAFFWFCGRSFNISTDHDAHNWLHKQLQLTAEQEQKLEPIENRFHESESTLMANIQKANQKLAKAIAEDKRYSENVTKAVEDIHHAQGALQKLTIEHFFEMQTVLTPAQIDKLNRLATDALLKNQ